MKIEEIKRYACGNGEGMFYDKDGYWVAATDIQSLSKQLDEAKAENENLLRLYNQSVSDSVEVLENTEAELTEVKAERDKLKYSSCVITDNSAVNEELLKRNKAQEEKIKEFEEGFKKILNSSDLEMKDGDFAREIAEKLTK